MTYLYLLADVSRPHITAHFIGTHDDIPRGWTYVSRMSATWNR